MNQREAFEGFAAGRYHRAKAEILIRLDEFTEREALAVLDSAKAEIFLRGAWIVSATPRGQLVKENRGEKVLGQVLDGVLG